MKRARIVIGASFGDEGKGLFTDHLCSSGAGMVVRFSGGANAGHTVVTPEGRHHIFRHVGSGAFLGVPTFLSQFFICNPILFFQELKELEAIGINPRVYAHPDCLITTFVDMLINQHKELNRGSKKHGSCGVGFHETQARCRVPELKITMGDLWNGGRRLESQLDQISTTYSKFRCGKEHKEPSMIQAFLECCQRFAEIVHPLGIGQCEDPVFEGSQGLLLSQDNKEFFPHVTHSHTGMKNVNVLCQQAGISEKEIFYISRTYLTRHGAGPLPHEDGDLSYEDNTNHSNPYQGSIRFAPLDCKKLVERLALDSQGMAHHLVLTHCDQKSPEMQAAFYSHGPCRTNVSTRPIPAIGVIATSKP